jgi:hypothetical protein
MSEMVDGMHLARLSWVIDELRQAYRLPPRPLPGDVDLA